MIERKGKRVCCFRSGKRRFSGNASADQPDDDGNGGDDRSHGEQERAEIAEPFPGTEQSDEGDKDEGDLRDGAVQDACDGQRAAEDDPDDGGDKINISRRRACPQPLHAERKQHAESDRGGVDNGV